MAYIYFAKLTLTLLTRKSPKHIIVSFEINHFLYKLNHQRPVQSEIGGFLFLPPSALVNLSKPVNAE